MDAYLFARQATPAARDAVIALVGDGVVRVAVPLFGEYALLAAIEGETATDIDDARRRVESVEGLGRIDAVLGVLPTDHGPDLDASALRIVVGIPIPQPVRAPVAAVVGFALLRCAPGQALDVYHRVVRQRGVVGAIIGTGREPTVLAEATSDLGADVVLILDQVAEVAGVTGAGVSVGFRQLGAGFTPA